MSQTSKILSIVTFMGIIQILCIAYASAQDRSVQPRNGKSHNSCDEIPSEIITWEFLKTCLPMHPQYQMSLNRIQGAQGELATAKSVPNPSFEIRRKKAKDELTSETTSNWSYETEFPLSWLIQRSFNIKTSTSELIATQQDSNDERREILLQMGTLFWSALSDQALLQEIQNLELEMQKLSKSVSRRVEVGEVRPVEKLKVEVEMEMIQSELDFTQRQLESEMGRLSVWLIGENRYLQVNGDLTAELSLPEFSEIRSKVFAADPRLLAAQSRREASDADLSLAKMERFPSLALNASIETSAREETYETGIAFELPLFNWNSGAIRKARSISLERRIHIDLLKREIEDALLQVFNDCQSSLSLVARYRENILPRAQSIVQTTEKTYQAGESGLMEVIDARRVVLETQKEYITAMTRAQIDFLTLSILMGKEDTP